MFRFGIVGCGAIARIHAEAVSGIENACLHGVTDHLPSAAQAFASAHGGKAYADYGEMLADKEIDVVIICTPSYLHAEQAIAALRAGKHVVLEKPMALSAAAADEVIAVAEQTGKLITVISQLRFSEDIQLVKRLVSEGAFGKISFCGLYMQYYRNDAYYAQSSWRGTLAYDGGGALMNQGIHGIDLLGYLMGGIKSAEGKIATLSHQIEVEDTAVATVTFEGGALGVIVGSTCAYPGFERRIEIHGDEGYVVLRENRIERMMVKGEEHAERTLPVTKTAFDPVAMSSELHRRQIENLLAAVEGKEALLIDGREGKRAVEVIESIYNR